MALCDLPLDAWTHVQGSLSQRDLGALAQTSSALRDVVRRVVLHRGAIVDHRAANAFDTDTKTLVIKAMPRVYGPYVPPYPPLRPPTLPSLESLDLRHPRFPSRGGFWHAVFATCPALRTVNLRANFFVNNYADDVHAVCDLVELGVPRLRELSLEGEYLVLRAPHHSRRISEAMDRVRHLGALASTSLRRLRHACKQVPVVVDAPLEHLEMDEGADLVLPRMPRVTDVTSAVYTAHWPRFDAVHLGRLTALRDLDLGVAGVFCPSRMAACLATLRHLPPGLARLVLRLDLWLLRGYDSDITWGEPLAHLRDLHDLEVRCMFAPTSVAALLGGWMGAAPRRARLQVEECASAAWHEAIERAYDEYGPDLDFLDPELAELQTELVRATRPVDGAGLCRWLDAHPVSVVHVSRVVRVDALHPRMHPL